MRYPKKCFLPRSPPPGLLVVSQFFCRGILLSLIKQNARPGQGGWGGSGDLPPFFCRLHSTRKDALFPRSLPKSPGVLRECPRASPQSRSAADVAKKSDEPVPNPFPSATRIHCGSCPCSSANVFVQQCRTPNKMIQLGLKADPRCLANSNGLFGVSSNIQIRNALRPGLIFLLIQ